ncbi:MAG: NADH-quinone oxidoreductase subunit N [Planctomycetota bacterium]|jgi:NADH-quinone oxidoreductase subunit N|nr:NADH-quinone oxidoreductase subunit N [Planctomycetota bacterium]
MLSELMAILAPVTVLALGALVCLGAEPFLKDARKHVVLPWVGTVFAVLAALVQFGVAGDAVDLHGLYAADGMRSWLSLTVILCAVIGLSGLQQSLSRDAYPGGEPYALTLLAACGVMLMVAASDYLGLFVGLELASISIYSAVGLRRHRLESGEALLKYFVMGAVFSAVFMYGVALSYGASGSTAYSAVALEGRDALQYLGQTLIVVALLFKVGAVPFHFWAPDAYTGAPVPVTGFMAAVVKIGGFTALGAIWLSRLAVASDGGLAGSVIPLGAHYTVEEMASSGLERGHHILIAAAILSLLVGNFSALGQSTLRRLIAFSSISHAGYMLLAFALPGTVQPVAMTSLWFYLMAYAVASAATMTAATALCGRDDDDRLIDLHGAARRHPMLGVALSILVASMAGLPPTAGFLGKYLIFSELVAKGHVILAVLGMLMAVVGAVYYMRFVIGLWSGDGNRVPVRGLGGLAWASVAVAVVVTVALLAMPGVIIDMPAAPIASTAP